MESPGESTRVSYTGLPGPSATPSGPLLPRALNYSRHRFSRTMDDAFFLAKESLLSCVPLCPPHRPRLPTFFDEDCLTKQKRVRSLQHRASNHLDILPQLAQERKEFKILLNSKRKSALDAYQKGLVKEAVERPWKFNPRRNGFSACPIPLEDWEIHFRALLNPTDSDPDFSDTLRFTNDGSATSPTNRPFSQSEIEECIVHSKDKKGAGADGLTNEHLKGSLFAFGAFWTALLNCIFSSGRMIGDWRVSHLKVLFKGKGSLLDPGAYRGIALLPHIFKIYTKLLAQRLLSAISPSLPTEQHGFLRRRSVNGAFRILKNHVEACLSRPKTPLYCVFVDYRKAFDSIPREKVICKLKDYHGVGGTLLKAICAVLQANFVLVDDGLKLSSPIRQTQGVLQGDSLSPLLFISYLADLPGKLSNCGVSVVLYADDLLFLSKQREDIHRALNILKNWSDDNGMTVNVDKTKIMKFRRGGKLSKDDVFRYDDQVIDIVSSFEYLGITVQTTWTFTEHIQKRVLKTVIRSNAIPHLQSLSLVAAKKFWNVMLAPIARYGITDIWGDLTANQLAQLDRAKFSFFKKVLGVHRSASNRKVMILAEIDSLCEDLAKSGLVPRTEVFVTYLSNLESRLSELDPIFFESPAVIHDHWKEACYQRRHVVTRFAIHGFHHFLCIDRESHEGADYCICRFCGGGLDLLHGLACGGFVSLRRLVDRADAERLE